MLRHLFAIFVRHQKTRILSIIKSPNRLLKLYLGSPKRLKHVQLNGYNDIHRKEIEHNSFKTFISTVTGMSAEEDPVNRRDDEKEDTQSEGLNSKSSSIKSPLSIHHIVDQETLDALSESYAEVRRHRSSDWLDCANRSCFIYLYKGGGDPNDTLAAFDLDGTLIRPKSNKRIPRSATDWDFFSVWTKVKLQQILASNKARFVIFTNQNGVGLNIVPLEEVQKRIELVTKRLDIPCTVFVAIDKNEFRKPMTGMFKIFTESFNESKPIDFEKSFYCGDAVGYPSHSDADIKFAQTLGLPFLPPDKFVRGVKPKLVIS